MSQEILLACDLSAFTPEERTRHEHVAQQMIGSRQSIRELDDGYALELPYDAYDLAVEFIRMEHRCCPFFRLTLEVEPGDGGLWLSVHGSGDIKAFAAQEFGFA